MSLFQLIALVISITAIISVANERLLRLPAVIGPMSAALVLSALLMLAEWLGIGPGASRFAAVVLQLDFSSVVLDGLLGFLLFAGAMHVPIRLLEEQRRMIFALAVIATMVSTVVTGTALWWLAGFVDLPISFLQALAFGALIAPTDPVAVLALLKSAGLPKRLEVIISGESLFNDAIGVILFLLLSGMAFGGEHYSPGDGATLLFREVGGGIAAGLVFGGLAFYLLEKSSDKATHISG